jgi:peptidoglycan/LPS O-acetylase OafA/YrhL
MSKLPSLTAMRFFAAFWVFCFHSFLWMGHSSVIADLSSVGYAGVSVFFVLSGFILSYNYLGSDFTLKEFWAARAARIAPVYWLTLLLGFLPLVRNLMIGRLSPSISVIAAPVFLQSWFPVPQIWNTPAWSVSTEVFFYIIFPFAIRGFVGPFRRHPVLFGLLLWLLSAAPTVLYAYFLPEGKVDIASNHFWLDVVKLNPLVRAPEFLLGVLVGVGFRDGWRIGWPKLSAAACLVAISLTIVALHNAPYPLFHNGLCAPLFALLILSVASADPWLNWAPLVLLGEASYSLYLLAYPVGALYSLASENLDFVPPRASVMGFVLYFVLCVASSLIVYTFFEKPCRRRVRAFLSPRTLAPPALT